MSSSDPQTATGETTFCAPAGRRFVLVSAILASSMAFIDSAVASIAIPALRADLGAGFADAQWINNAYLLTLASLLLLGGAAGDRFGLKRVFMAGIAGFVVASIGCALAPDPMSLILARAAQGVGAAFMIPGSLAIISAAYPREERGRAIGLWASASALTTILGPIVGGLVLTAFGDWAWRVVFAVNLPLGALAFALLSLRVPADTPTAVRRLDVVGAAMASLALLAIAYGLTGSGNDGAPVISHIATYCGLGLVLMALFAAWEFRTPAPMVPPAIFANRAFAGANALTLMLYFSLGATLFFLPMLMIAGWGESPATVAIALSPLGVALTILSPLAGRLTERFGANRLVGTGAALAGCAFLGMGLSAPFMQVWTLLMPLQALLGVGMGLVVSPLSTAVMSALNEGRGGLASGVNNAVSRISSLLAVAIGGIVVAAAYERGLGDLAELPVFFGVAPETPLTAAEDAVRISAGNGAFAALCWLTAALALTSSVVAVLTLPGRSAAV